MVLTTLTDDKIEEIETKVFDLAFYFLMDYGIDINVIIKNLLRNFANHFYYTSIP